MGKELKERYEHLYPWVKDEDITEAVNDFCNMNTSSEEEIRKKTEKVEKQMGGQFDDLLETNSLMVKELTQREILLSLKNEGLIDEERYKRNIGWLDVRYVIGKGRGLSVKGSEISSTSDKE